MSCIQLFELSSTATGASETDVFKKLVNGIRMTQGIRSVSWVPQCENETTIGVVANFDSLHAHEKWTATTQYAETTDLLVSLSPNYTSEVVVLPADAEPSLHAETVEVVTWVYPANQVDAAFEKKAIDGFNKFGESISPSKWASGGMVAGWNTKTHTVNGESVRYFTGLIGWKSMEAHYECKKTPTFTDHIHHMVLGDVRVDMCHYNYSQNRV